MSSLKAINAQLFARYQDIVRRAQATGEEDPFGQHPRLSLKNLQWMCETAIAMSEDMVDDKASRWLGFVQGCLATRGLIDVDEERDITRPMFHSVYEKDGGIPDSLARN
jgi:hypothetical protein